MVRTTREVLDKLVDGDSVPIDLLSLFEAVIQPGAPGREDTQLSQLSDQHRRTCRPNKRLRMRCSQRARTWSTKRGYIAVPLSMCSLGLMTCKSRFPKLVQTLDGKRISEAGPGAVNTRIQPAAKTLLSLARKHPP